MQNKCSRNSQSNSGTAVLVAIAIPVFTTQLEKSRDSVSVANLRSAYAQAQTEALTATKSSTAGDVKVTVTAAVNATGSTAATAARLSKVEVRNVVIKSQKANDWSGLAQELPFYKKLMSAGTGGAAAAEDQTNHLDKGQNGYVTVTFNYTPEGEDLDISSVTLGDMYTEAKDGNNW